jgi:regulator of sirC expression with transglutaminase-like and TPR domain
MSEKAKEAFAVELRKKDSQINLANAALLFSEYLTEDFDRSIYLTLLDDIAASIRPSLQAAGSDQERIEILNQYLFEDLKFAGNSANYYAPHNSFLNKVLDMRTGIPISLSAIYLEIGWRLELPLWGIGLPRHFIVGYGPTTAPVYVDVFNQGRTLSEDECLAVSQTPISDRMAFRQEFLKPATKKAILFRMLLNLKHIYVRLENWETAYKTVDLLLIVEPEQTLEMRDRGLIAYRLNRLHAATYDIERYLFLAPNNPDAEWLNKQLEMMEEKLLRLN